MKEEIKQDYIPILFGNSEIIKKEQHINCSFDLFGSCFYLLSRYEEVFITNKDKHDRVLLKSTIIEEYVLRPLVNEYIELLWYFIKELDSTIKRKERKFNIKVSCDVDHIEDYTLKYPKYFIRSLLSNVIREKSLPLAIKTFKSGFNYHFNKKRYYNSYDTFNYTMDACESNKLVQEFYFISGNTAGDIDGFYKLGDVKIKQIIKNIYKRGHKIGIHFSYNTYNNSNNAKKELINLSEALEELNIPKNEIKGGRQHFLRWDATITPKIWNDLGLKFDSTLAFAEHIGFRSSCCYEYPLYDLINRKQLKVIEIPLTFMECSLIGANYMGFGYTDKAYETIRNLKKVVKTYNGTLSVLWHNSFFRSQDDKKMFEYIIKD